MGAEAVAVEFVPTVDRTRQDGCLARVAQVRYRTRVGNLSGRCLFELFSAVGGHGFEVYRVMKLLVGKKKVEL